MRLVGKPAALLVALLLRANEAVPSARLIDELWGEAPPRSARKLLQAYVSQLRKALGHERLQTVGTGYLLAAGAGEVDVLRFRRLLDDGRPDEALALWRGPALADLREEASAETAAARLEELRVHALEARADARLGLGAGRELVPELEALVAEHPLRERLRGQLMLALYRAGRQADALVRYREGRAALAEQLGLEPARELRRLEQAILAHDPALEVAAPRALRASLVVVGDDERAVELLAPVARARELELLLVRLASDAAGLGPATDALAAKRRELTRRGIACRVAALRGGSASRVAAGPGVELVVACAEPGDLSPLDDELSADVAVLVRSERPVGRGPVVVPFGGGENEWSALELGAAVAAAHGVELVLVGGARGGADASGSLAAASLAVQRVSEIVARPLVVRGPAEIAAAAEDATVLLLGVPDDWRRDGLGEHRTALADASPAPVLLVRRGGRVPALAPDGTVTRFTWSR